MQNNYSAFRVPSFERDELYNFATTKETFALYRELTAIAEEIEQCRNRNT